MVFVTSFVLIVALQVCSVVCPQSLLCSWTIEGNNKECHFSSDSSKHNVSRTTLWCVSALLTYKENNVSVLQPLQVVLELTSSLALWTASFGLCLSHICCPPLWFPGQPLSKNRPFLGDGRPHGSDLLHYLLPLLGKLRCCLFKIWTISDYGQ